MQSKKGKVLLAAVLALMVALMVPMTGLAISPADIGYEGSNVEKTE